MRDLRAGTGADTSGLSLDVAALRSPSGYTSALAEVTLTLVRQPLHRLQKLPGGAGEPACGRCNGSKLHALPAVDLVDRALARERTVLEEIADRITWPTQYDRVVAAARGLYRGQPAGTPTWAGPGRSSYLGGDAAPAWLRDR